MGLSGFWPNFDRVVADFVRRKPRETTRERLSRENVELMIARNRAEQECEQWRSMAVNARAELHLMRTGEHPDWHTLSETLEAEVS